MVRSELKLSKSQLPESRLWSLWRAIDENENGFICAGEFGRFMRSSTEGQVSAESELQDKIRESNALSILKRNEDWSRLSAQRSAEAAKQMEAEAARLEALLSAVPRVSAGGRRSLAGAQSMPQLPSLRDREHRGEAEEGTAGTPAGADGLMSSGVAPALTRAEKLRVRQLSQQVRAGGAYRLGAEGKVIRGMLKEERLG